MNYITCAQHVYTLKPLKKLDLTKFFVAISSFLFTSVHFEFMNNLKSHPSATRGCAYNAVCLYRV